jgi:hypothetical protein
MFKLKSIGISIGVIVMRKAPANIDAAIKAADNPMYQVRKSGKNNIRIESITNREISFQHSTAVTLSDNFFQLINVRDKSFTSGRGDGTGGMRLFPYKGLVDADHPVFFQFPKMGAQIAVGGTGSFFQKTEIGFFDGDQYGKHSQSDRGVDDRVQIQNGLSFQHIVFSAGT